MEIAVVGAVGVVIGAVIAVVGSIVAERLRVEGERNQWQLDRRLEIYTDLLESSFAVRQAAQYCASEGQSV